jgi:hypothetical protein
MWYIRGFRPTDVCFICRVIIIIEARFATRGHEVVFLDFDFTGIVPLLCKF